MLSIRRLVWDRWSVAHIARHGVSPREVEEVCHGEPVTRRTYRGRFRVLGPTQRGRMLTVILAPTKAGGIYYSVTARPADAKERRIYQQQQGEQS